MNDLTVEDVEVIKKAVMLYSQEAPKLVPRITLERLGIVPRPVPLIKPDGEFDLEINGTLVNCHISQINVEYLNGFNELKECRVKIDAISLTRRVDMEKR